MDIVAQLTDALGQDSVRSASEASQRMASNWQKSTPLSCKALVLPKTTQGVATALRLCHEAHQPVVPHGGLTNVVGGAVTQAHEIALSLERMNQIEEIDETNRTATVQAGVVLQQLQRAAADRGLLFPLDLGAKGSCMIGGNIATNAGGLQALRYGVTRQLVLGLEVVLADGTVLSSMNKMLKNNAGYDLKQLFIGSEGTLGVITRAVLKLEAAPQSRQTALVAVAGFGEAVQLLNSAKRVLGNTLTTYELIWQDYYRLMTTPPSVFAPPLAQHYPFYLLIETLGQDPQTDAQVFQDFLEQAIHQGLVADAALVQSQREFDWFWGIREKVEHVFSVHNPVFLFDVSVAISDMGAYIDTIVKDLRAVWPAVHFYAFGHMADGNLHLYVSCGQADAATRHRVEQLVFEPLRQIGGSITAEHGVGLEKKEWLHFSRTPAEINLMKALKQTLDPRGILNPGKIWS